MNRRPGEKGEEGKERNNADHAKGRIAVADYSAMQNLT